ncbi:peptidoglycan binding protein CsiV [Porticoccaceae bacterium]|nr:peptidoglycan binding protein CsiV [Porticoccaceae bacterium]MDC3200040.1 peptidoglycan binding protein CsiV [Porticoccaceae bacterium]
MTIFKTNESQRGINQKSHSFKKLLATMLMLLSVFAAGQQSDSDEEIIPPQNWYQVEVILFTQDGNIGEEVPPLDYDLSFPDDILELIDVEALAEQQKLAIVGALLPEMPKMSLVEASPFVGFIPLIDMQDPAISPITDNLAESIIGEAPALSDLLSTIDTPVEPYVPEYEDPFEMLAIDQRDLNDSARVLSRRDYNVIFHQAWRFVADENSNDPWILVHAGQKVGNRAEVEGSLRFYKSRFLHFETNLWRLKLANENSVEQTSLAKLPDVPQMDSDDTTLAWRLIPIAKETEMTEVTESTDLDLNTEELTSENELFTELESASQTLDKSHSGYTLVSFDPREADMEDQEQIEIPVTEVWSIAQSKRIEEQSVYYLDHPELGIMLTIKSYEPQPTNPSPVTEDTEILEQ